MVDVVDLHMRVLIMTGNVLNVIFLVFDSKSRCGKCSTERPSNRKAPEYNKFLESTEWTDFIRSIRKAEHDKFLDAPVSCWQCRKNGRVYNKDPFDPKIKYHNCWKN
jgi:hypothetical protein